MSTTSITPGRVRFRSSLLRGQKGRCHWLEKSLSSMEGVFHAKANFRTGGILIIFDDKRIASETLANSVRYLLKNIDETSVPVITDDSESCILWQAAMGFAARALFPRPLNVLASTAMKLLRSPRFEASNTTVTAEFRAV